MRRARHSILLLGWNFDPRIRLEPDRPELDEADRLGPFLKALLAARPELRVYLLVWDMYPPVAAAFNFVPQLARGWLKAERLHYRLDARHPIGACHHQKVLVVDDAVAFCGGMDFAGDRWDTPAHGDRQPLRRTPEGSAYRPRHDLMLAVDGAPAAALGDLVRERWHAATGERLPAPPPDAEAWPEGLGPAFHHVPVGIARTLPGGRGRDAVLESAALLLAAIASARRWIYLESQYVTAPAIAAALARRLQEPDGPEVVLLCPDRSPSYFDRLAMDPARAGFLRRLRLADRYGRSRVLAPLTAGGAAIIVHSKLMVVDDRLLRVGSANLNNRSLGFDSECDLAIEATGPGAAGTRQAIRRTLCRLLAEHLGAEPEAVGAVLARTRSLLVTLAAFHRPHGRRLHPVDGPAWTALNAAIAATHLFDPRGMDDNWRPMRRLPWLG